MNSKVYEQWPKNRETLLFFLFKHAASPQAVLPNKYPDFKEETYLLGSCCINPNSLPLVDLGKELKKKRKKMLCALFSYFLALLKRAKENSVYERH